MEIVVRGIAKDQSPQMWAGKCDSCESLIRAENKEVTVVSTDVATAACPVCNKSMWFKREG